MSDRLPPHSSTLFGKPDDGGFFDDVARERILAIRRYLVDRKLPAVVIQLPPDNELPSNFSPWTPEATLAFANLLGVPFWDGREAYRSMSDRDYSALFLKNDPHWNQEGSDYFAEATIKYLRQNPLQPPRLSDWQPFWYRLGIRVEVSTVVDKPGAMRVTPHRENVTEPPNDWEARLIHDVAIHDQQKYVCTFEAKSDEPRHLSCMIFDPKETKSDLGFWKQFDLTPEWQTYRAEFLANQSLEHCNLAFQFGDAEIPFEISNISFEPVRE